MKLLTTNQKGAIGLEFIIIAGIVVIFVGLSMSAWMRQATDVNRQVHATINLAQEEFASVSGG